MMFWGKSASFVAKYRILSSEVEKEMSLAEAVETKAWILTGSLSILALMIWSVWDCQSCLMEANWGVISKRLLEVMGVSRDKR